MEKRMKKTAFLLYKVDPSNRDFDDVLIGLLHSNGGHYCETYSGLFIFDLGDSSPDAISTIIKTCTKPSDSVVFVYESKNSKYTSKKIR